MPACCKSTSSAEKGAHLHDIHEAHSNSPGDFSPPDIFSVVAQENLLKALQPAYQHVCKVISNHNPAQFGWLYQFSDEIFVVLHGLIERSSLLQTGSSFSERFYGLKRVSKDSSPINDRLRLLSLIALVGTPYISRKCETFFEQQLILEADGHLNDKAPRTRLIKAFLRLYPYLHSIYSGASFVYYLLFTVNLIHVSNPLLHVCGMKLSYLGKDDIEHTSLPWSSLFGISTIREKLQFMVLKIRSDAPTFLHWLFSSGVFFLTFLQGFSAHQDTTQATVNVERASQVPAPQLPPVKKFNSPLTCPVCLKTRTNDTALSSSGYVFCYPCIYMYVQKYQKCPVTGFKATLDNLIKIYRSES